MSTLFVQQLEKNLMKCDKCTQEATLHVAHETIRVDLCPQHAPEEIRHGTITMSGDVKILINREKGSVAFKA